MKLTRRIDFDELLRNLSTIFAAVANSREEVIVEAEGKRIKLVPIDQTVADSDQTVRRQLSDAEVVAGLKALEQARQLTLQMSQSRGGKPLAESWEDIRKDREERSKHWL